MATTTITSTSSTINSITLTWTKSNNNYNYLIISWRGFNGNNGKPTEQGLYDDGRNAVKWLEKNNIPKDKIILYGESLGTGVAVELAQNQKFAGVVLESPYTSIGDVAKIRYPYLPVDILLKDKFLTIKKIENIFAKSSFIASRISLDICQHYPHGLVESYDTI